MDLQEAKVKISAILDKADKMASLTFWTKKDDKVIDFLQQEKVVQMLAEAYLLYLEAEQAVLDEINKKPEAETKV